MNTLSITRIGRICFFLAIVIIAGPWGCAKMPVKTPPEKPPASEKKMSELEKSQKDSALTHILLAEAEKFSTQENYQDALFVYNQALALAKPGESKTIITGVEKVLAKTHPHVIEAFLKIKNLSIPRPLLFYWLGLNHASQNNYAQAQKALEIFIGTYPDHAYAEDARDLLVSMKSSTFKRDTIGCMLPLSGKYQIFGQRALQGVEMAIQDLSARHGQNFHVVIKDTQSNPERAVECVDELSQERVMGILGPILTEETAGTRAEELGIPMIALTQKSDFPLQGEYLFSNFITPEMQVQALASYVFTELGLQRVAILYPNERYGQRYMELFWDAVNGFNGQVVGVESYDGENTDFTIPIQKLTGEFYPVPKFLKSNRPETENTSEDTESNAGDSSDRGKKVQIDFQALFIPDSPSRLNLILPQLAFNDVRNMVLLGTNLWHQESLLTGAKGYNKNAVIVDGYFGDSQNPITVDFEKRFKLLYGTRPGFIEAIAYDTAVILLSAAMDEQVDSRESLKNTLQGSRLFEGVTGNTIFDKTGSAHKQLFLITIKKEKFMEIRH
ncbi:MAG: penicillin-binding protein activator [Proteobacteria bacterium]|nr:penicillin-binding protein activator [Pseudomonadota bacterium]